MRKISIKIGLLFLVTELMNLAQLDNNTFTIHKESMRKILVVDDEERMRNLKLVRKTERSIPISVTSGTN